MGGDAVRGRHLNAADDAVLRRFHAEGHTDSGIAYIMGLNRSTIANGRKRLGLPLNRHKPTGMRGVMFTEEMRRHYSEANRRRLEDPAYRESLVALAARARTFKRTDFFRLPPKGTAEFRQYKKLLDVLGPEKARAACL